METTSTPGALSTFLPKISLHFWDMHRWQRRVLSIAILLFGAGSVSQLTNYFNNPPTDAPQAVDGSTSNTAPIHEPTLREKVSPWATRVGAGFIGGFVLGFALRTFVRITMTLLALGTALFVGLSYFNVMNVDLTAAKTKYDNSIHWAQDQAERLEKSAESHLPHSSGGAFGVFSGFRRKRMAT